MPFPTVGSWISQIQSAPSDNGMTNLRFVCTYTTGSSNVEYAIFDSTNSTAFIPFTTAASGSNTIPISALINQNYRTHFRMIGYPSIGFNAFVRHYFVEETGVGAELQTTNLGSDVKLSSTAYSKAYVKPYGSYHWTLYGSVSSDSGNTWTPINSFGNEFSITSTQGSECLIRLKDLTGSVVLDRLVAYFHTSDVT